MLATRAVIRTGLSRSAAPSRIAAGISSPRCRSELIWLTSTIPLRTATPKSAMNPIEADRFKFNPRHQRAPIPPTNAKGTFRRIRLACRME